MGGCRWVKILKLNGTLVKLIVMSATACATIRQYSFVGTHIEITRTLALLVLPRRFGGLADLVSKTEEVKALFVRN